jgi:tRNA (cytidine/uridine-2'-O-)-methyltransferase
LRIALYQPDMPQNVGAAIRVAACFGAGIDLVGPMGFPAGAREIRRVAMDYATAVPPVAHAGWSSFLADRAPGRLVLLTTRATLPVWAFDFRETDTVLLGRESAGVPEDVHEAADARLVIPLAPGARSLNVAVAAAVALAEARRQMVGSWNR